MVRVSGLCTSIVSGRFWCVAVLSAAGAIGATYRADAALYYWQDSEPSLYQPSPFPQPRRHKVRPHSVKKDTTEKEAAAKPQGPLIIAVSISKQQLKIYDANGFFAQSPVSSGMPGHSTPMGVFSVIQKHKLHHSNIYSNAPMPFMQRITWSGVALHAGVLPGYPASHGCIRMPMSFAVKMWNWTRMGARVIVTPGEMMPEPVSHPLLPAFKVAPQPAVAEQPMPDVPVPAKADKGAPSQASANLELRSTVGHGNAVTPVSDVAQVMLRDRTHTADAADAKGMVTMSDAAKADASKSSEKPAGTAKATSDAVQSAPDDKKDQARLIKLEVPKRAGQIAVFISRKDSKIYVRQNFAPLFDAPVTIASSDRPLGTHVFTVDVDRTDPNALHWSAVSPLGSNRSVMRSEDKARNVRRWKNASASAAVEAKPASTPDSAVEALDRITIPADIMARIAEALTTGGSIIVSDQGINQGETGEGTDFIVSLR
jgi:lipoprotein-anchoring transpeptidase ErfK/SrfK